MFPTPSTVYQRGPNTHGQYTAPHYGTHTPHQRSSRVSGYHHAPYPTSPQSPTRPPEVPLTNDEMFLYTSAWPYKCGCGEVFRGRSQIGLHVQQNFGHRELNPGKNLRPCVRNCGRTIDDLEDLVDHLERRHNIQQDIREIFTPYFDRPRSYTASIIRTTPTSPPATAPDYSSFAMQQSSSFLQASSPQQSALPHNIGLTSANLAYHKSQFPAAPNPGTLYPPSCVSPNPSDFTTTTATTDSDAGHWHFSGPPLVREIKLYTCKCSRAYKRRVDLEAHIGTPVRNHYDITVYKFDCMYCDKKHPTEEGIQRHMELTHGMKHTKADVQQAALAVAARSPPPQGGDTAGKRRKSSMQTSASVDVPITQGVLKPLPPKIAEYYRNLEPFKCKCTGAFITHTSLMSHVQYYQRKGFGEPHGDASGADRYLHPCVVCNQFKFTTPKQLKFHLNEHHKMEYVK